MQKINFNLDSNLIEELQTYSQLLNKDINTIIKEALEDYFYKAQQELLKESLEKENAQTNLSFDEFWDGVDLD